MGYERLVAGIFAGLGSLILIGVGLYTEKPESVTTGAIILSGMMAYFVGEKNGQAKAT